MEFEPMTLGSLARRPTVLIVLHQEHSTPGRIGIALKAMGRVGVWRGGYRSSISVCRPFRLAVP
jgi:hypothetical protein